MTIIGPAHKITDSPQVRGFFNTDFRPSRVVIIRPPQLGPDYTYVIPPPGDEAMSGANSYFSPKPYIPGSLSEINDQLGSMILYAPTFLDRTLVFPDRNTDTEFDTLVKGFEVVRKKVGEERYAALTDLAARAKALFAADQDDSNGKTDQGRALLFEIEDILRAVRRSRVKAKLPDDEGEVTGDWQTFPDAPSADLRPL